MKLDYFKLIAERLSICESAVAKDGIRYRGSHTYENGYHYNNPGNEHQMWQNAKVPSVVISKDLNDTEPWDIRGETGLKNHVSTPTIGCRWYRNLMRYEYLIYSSIVFDFRPPFEVLRDIDLIKFFNSSASARINCKKVPGGGSCPDNVLKEHIDLYGDIVREQISDLDAKIITIAGCSGNVILDNIVRPVYTDLKKINDWIYYSSSKDVIVINGYNPNPRFRKDKDCYNELRGALEHFSTTPEYQRFRINHGLI